jgi:hypothetical protein
MYLRGHLNIHQVPHDNVKIREKRWQSRTLNYVITPLYKIYIVAPFPGSVGVQINDDYNGSIP